MDRYTDLFHPAAPIDDATLLVGRDRELKTLHTLLQHVAEHPVIVGPRGIGKTSILSVISSSHSDVGKVNCATYSTFDDIAKSILHWLGFDVMVSESVQKTGREFRGIFSIPTIVSSEAKSKSERERKRLEIGQIEVDEHLLFRILVGMNKPILITIDEYDRVQDDVTKIRLADFIKMLSDANEAHCVRVLFAGVAKSKNALIGAHPSISRQTHEMLLKPLKPGDFVTYMKIAESKLNLKISDSVKKEISRSSFGQPYYMHLFCLEAIEVMRDRNPRSQILTYDDFQKSKDRVAHKAYNDELKQFGPALLRIKANKIAFNTLRTLCEQNKDEIPSPELFKYAERTKFQALNDLAKGLEFLQSEGIIQPFTGSKIINFSDPLLKPFLMLRFKELRQSYNSNSLQPNLFQPDLDTDNPSTDLSIQEENDD